MRRAAGSLVAALAALVPRAATAAPGPDASLEPYAASVRVVVLARPAGPVFTLAPTGRSGWPPEPQGTANVEVQARAAYGAMARSVFRDVVDADADLDVEISVAQVDVGRRSDGSLASVEHAIVLRSRDRAELARLYVRGEAQFIASHDGAMAGALDRAARDAADELEAELEETPAVARWLRERGIPPRPARSAPPSERRAIAGARPWRVVYADAGGAIVDGTPGFSARAGTSMPLFLLDVSYARWDASRSTPNFVPGGNGDTTFHLTEFGVDAGIASRATPAVELRGGVGVSLLQGDATAPTDPRSGRQSVGQSLDGGGVSLFAGVVYSYCPEAARVCWRLGGELRRHLLSEVEAFGAQTDAAQTTISLTVGLEYPWGGGRPR